MIRMITVIMCILPALWISPANAGEPVNAAGPVKEAADKAAHIAAAIELLQTFQYEKTLDESIRNMLDLQIKQNPSIAPFREIMYRFIAKYMSWESLKDEFAQIYVSEFTVLELREMAVFYKSPVGKKSALLMPKLMIKGAEIGMKRVQDHMPELQQMIAEESLKLQESPEKEKNKN